MIWRRVCTPLRTPSVSPPTTSMPEHAMVRRYSCGSRDEGSSLSVMNDFQHEACGGTGCAVAAFGAGSPATMTSLAMSQRRPVAASISSASWVGKTPAMSSMSRSSEMRPTSGNATGTGAPASSESAASPFNVTDCGSGMRSNDMSSSPQQYRYCTVHPFVAGSRSGRRCARHHHSHHLQ